MGKAVVPTEDMACCRHCGRSLPRYEMAPLRFLCEPCHKAQERRGRRERYEHNKQAGLCPRCGGERDRDGRIICSRCVRLVAYTTPERSEQVTCRHCGVERPRYQMVPSKHLCPPCYSQLSSVYGRNRYVRLKALGLCPKCGRERDRLDRVQCEKCRTIRSRRKRHPAGV